LTRAGAVLPFQVFTGDVVQVATHFLDSLVCASTGLSTPSVAASVVPIVAQRIQVLAVHGRACLLAAEMRVMIISLQSLLIPRRRRPNLNVFRLSPTEVPTRRHSGARFSHREFHASNTEIRKNGRPARCGVLKGGRDGNRNATLKNQVHHTDRT
jgi:hypothetical protein